MKKKKKNNGFFSLSFLNFFEMIGKRRNNELNDIDWNNNLISIIKELWQKSTSIEYIGPIILYRNILSIFKE